MKLGFIGAGNMAHAIMKGAVRQGYLRPSELMVFDVLKSQRDKAQSEFPGLAAAQSQRELTECCDALVLAVKPIFLEPVLQELKACARGKRIISIVTGWTFSMLSEALGPQCGAALLRVMPNTPAMVGAGMTALCEETTFDPESLEWAEGLFRTLGEVITVPERLIHAVIAVSGSSPAYAYLFIEAMADGAVKLGMPRPLAYRAAAQAVLGAAKMVLETGEHPGKLKDDVCSPGGTTIEAVGELERRGMRGAVLSAMEACAAKSVSMEQR